MYIRKKLCNFQKRSDVHSKPSHAPSPSAFKHLLLDEGITRPETPRQIRAIYRYLRTLRIGYKKRIKVL